MSRGWHLHQIDVQNAFLHGVLQEDVYMHQPPGYEDRRYPGYICKLENTLYGLKQAQEFCFPNQELGFVPSKADTSMFVLNREGAIIYMLIYVDDIVIASSSVQAADNLNHKLSRDFAVKDIGKLQYFVGIEATPSKK